jgi:hypothetical protein
MEEAQISDIHSPKGDFDSLRFLNKLAELISQKLVHREEQLFTVNCDLTVIYNPTYADT